MSSNFNVVRCAACNSPMDTMIATFGGTLCVDCDNRLEAEKAAEVARHQEMHAGARSPEDLDIEELYARLKDD